MTVNRILDPIMPVVYDEKGRRQEVDFWRQKYFDLVANQSKILVDLVNSILQPKIIPEKCPKCGHKFVLPDAKKCKG